MDPIILNTNVIKGIKEILPENINISGFLSDLLSLNQSAVYRRLRGEIAFSFFEIYLIAQKMGVSIDYLAQSASSESIIFEYIQQKFHETGGNSDRKPNKFEQVLGNILSDYSSSTFELAHNLFPQVPTHMFYHLSKYNSFKWAYNNNDLPNMPYKKIEYPREIFEMHKRNNMETMKIKYTSYIWDYTIIEILIREIKYFADINLIDSEDVAILKEELYEFLNYVSDLTIKGTFPTGNRVDIYISSLNSDAAYSYMQNSRYQLCIIGVFDLQYVISTDSVAVDIMKGKILSLKNGSTLISGSNEKYRLSFLKEQYRLVDTL